MLTKVCRQSCGFFSSHVWMWELDHKEGWDLRIWCFWTVVLEKILTSPLDCKEIKPSQFEMRSILNIHWKDLCWSRSCNTLATWCEVLTHWKKPWCWERLRAGGEGGDRGWDGWMPSPTQWTWVWASSGRWWRTGKPGVLQSIRSQRVGHNWATEQQQKETKAGLILEKWRSWLCFTYAAEQSQLSIYYHFRKEPSSCLDGLGHIPI